MDIKRSSWHCRISTFGDTYKQNDNLCCYFWRAVGKLGAWVFIASVVSIAIFIIIDGLLKDFNGFMGIAIYFGFFICILGFPYLTIFVLRSKFGDPYFGKISSENIVIVYLKAKKLKICPIITYVD